MTAVLLVLMISGLQLWGPASRSTQRSTPPICGNSKVEAGETCDDGGTVAGDGCSATCTVEAGYFCRESPSFCYPSLPVFFLDGDDVAAVDGAAVNTWASSPTTIPILDDAAHDPLSEAKALNGHKAVNFDGTADAMVITTSDTLGSFVPDSLGFDIVVTFHWDVPNDSWYLITNSQANTARGLTLGFDDVGHPWIFVANGTGAYHVNKVFTGTITPAKWHTVEFRGDGTNCKVSIDGAADETQAFATAVSLGVMGNTIALARDWPSASHYFDATFAQFIAYRRNLSATERTNIRATITRRYGAMPISPANRVAFLGDSITQGGHADNPFHQRLENDVNTAVPGSIAAANFGVLSDTTTGMYSRWTAKIKNKGFTHIHVLGCVNDLINAADNAGAQTTAEALCETKIGNIITEARADTSGAAGGMEVAVSTLTPCSTYSLWSTNRNNAAQTFNVWVRAQAATHVHVIEAAADSILGTGTTSVPGALNAGTDSGDHLHPNQVGSNEQLALVRTAFGL